MNKKTVPFMPVQYIHCTKCNLYVYYYREPEEIFRGVLRDLCDSCSFFDESQYNVGDKVISKHIGIGRNTITPKNEVATIHSIDNTYVHVTIDNQKGSLVGYSVPRASFNRSYDPYKEIEERIDESDESLGK